MKLSFPNDPGGALLTSYPCPETGIDKVARTDKLTDLYSQDYGWRGIHFQKAMVRWRHFFSNFVLSMHILWTSDTSFQI